MRLEEAAETAADNGSKSMAEERLGVQYQRTMHANVIGIGRR